MGRCYDPSGVVGRGCRDGMVRLRAWARREFGGGDLGCFNPQSKAGSGPSLHADGRADDIAFNAKNPASMAAGDRFFHWIIDHHAQLGLQETLWRGFLWSCQNAHLGIRGPGIQQGPHMNHVHWGVTYEAANDWTEEWLTGGTAPSPGSLPSRKKANAMIARDESTGAVWLIGVGACRHVLDTGNEWNRLKVAGVPDAGSMAPLKVIEWMMNWGAWDHAGKQPREVK